MERTINTLGKGWFIARLSNERKSTALNVDSARFDREAVYSKLSESDKDKMLESIIESRVLNGSRVAIRLETEPELSSKELYKIAFGLYRR